jgi:ubiquinone/menaquinone biosynthesis C-methylase UbiE
MMKTGVQKIFIEVAPTYEWVNRVLTLGLDGRWRKKAARAAPENGGGL